MKSTQQIRAWVSKIVVGLRRHAGRRLPPSAIGSMRWPTSRALGSQCRHVPSVAIHRSAAMGLHVAINQHQARSCLPARCCTMLCDTFLLNFEFSAIMVALLRRERCGHTGIIQRSQTFFATGELLCTLPTVSLGCSPSKTNKALLDLEGGWPRGRQSVGRGERGLSTK